GNAASRISTIFLESALSDYRSCHLVCGIGNNQQSTSILVYTGSFCFAAGNSKPIQDRKTISTINGNNMIGVICLNTRNINITAQHRRVRLDISLGQSALSSCEAAVKTDSYGQYE